MSSLVLELQQDACNPEIKTSDLLRKAYMIAKKLKATEFEEWIKNELDGYNCTSEEMPEYRKVHGELKYLDPYHGWKLVIVEEPEAAHAVQFRDVADPISHLEVLANTGDKTLSLGFPSENRKLLADALEMNTDFKTFFNRSQVESMLSRIRNIVLKWSLKLEEEGILGEDMRFTEDEKEKAQATTQIIINGDGASTQIQIGTNASSQNMTLSDDKMNQVKELLEKINENLNEIGLLPERIAEIEALVRDVNIEMSKDQPRPGFIRESFGSVRRILEGASGSVLAAGLVHMLGAFLS